MLKKLVAKTKIGKVAKAQLKITAIIIFYTIVGVFGMVTFTYYEVSDNYRERVTQRFLCASRGGTDLDCPANRPDTAIFTLSAIVIVMVSYISVMAIIFSCDPSAFKRKKKNGAPRRSSKAYSRSTTATSMLSNSSSIRSTTGPPSRAYARSTTATSIQSVTDTSKP